MLTQEGSKEVHGVGSVGYPEHGLALAEQLTLRSYTRAWRSILLAISPFPNPPQPTTRRTFAHWLHRTTGESTFAASDILASTRAATEILKDPRVEHAFGAHNLWMTVSSIMRRYGVAAPDPVSFVVRGKAGLTILSWLADAHQVINASVQPLVGLDNPVISAAVDWLQSSLAIEQSKTLAPPPAAGPPQPT